MRPEIMDGIRRHIQALEGLEQTELLEVAPGHARLAINITPKSLNLYGNIHGGFLFSLCDIASGIATYAYEVANVTQNSSIQFIKGISQGRIYIEANTIHKGSKTAVHQVTVTDEAGNLLVNAAFTMFLLSPI